MNKVITEIEKLYQELQDNKGIMPDNWKPYANWIIILLTMVEVFVPENVKLIIAEIIAAIKAAESL